MEDTATVREKRCKEVGMFEIDAPSGPLGITWTEASTPEPELSLMTCTQCPNQWHGRVGISGTLCGACEGTEDSTNSSSATENTGTNGSSTCVKVKDVNSVSILNGIVNVGDIILSIDGEDVSHLDANEIMSIMAGKSEQIRVLRFRDITYPTTIMVASR